MVNGITSPCPDWLYDTGLSQLSVPESTKAGKVDEMYCMSVGQTVQQSHVCLYGRNDSATYDFALVLLIFLTWHPRSVAAMAMIHAIQEPTLTTETSNNGRGVRLS